MTSTVSSGSKADIRKLNVSTGSCLRCTHCWRLTRSPRSHTMRSSSRAWMETAHPFISLEKTGRNWAPPRPSRLHSSAGADTAFIAKSGCRLSRFRRIAPEIICVPGRTAAETICTTSFSLAVRAIDLKAELISSASGPRSELSICLRLRPTLPNAFRTSPVDTALLMELRRRDRRCCCRRGFRHVDIFQLPLGSPLSE